MSTYATYEISEAQLVAKVHAAAQAGDRDTVLDLVYTLLERRCVTAALDFGEHSCDDCPNPDDHEIDFDMDGEPVSLIDDDADTALYVTDSLIHLAAVTAPACTGAPDLCGAPAGQPCAPGCPSLAV